MKIILVPVDFSAVTGRVCETAVALAKPLRGRVVLLHSVPPPVITSEYGVMLDDLAAMTKAGEQAAASQLARLQKRLKSKSVATEAVQLFGPPVPHIVAQAARLAAAYIVIGSHGHTAFHDLLVGSTTHGVLMKAACPVVVVPAKKKMPPAGKKRRLAAAGKKP